MIAFVSGTVADITEDNVIVDVGGVGMNVCISADTASRLPGIDQDVKLYTYTCVREDAFLLYGFLSKNELELFKKCITVNGIGPKGALALLSAFDADSLRFAIISEDVKAISKAPGIGPKTAQRLVLELKDKLPVDASMISREIAQNNGAADASFADQAQKKEALDALVALGYGRSESAKALNEIGDVTGMDSGAILKAALKKLL